MRATIATLTAVLMLAGSSVYAQQTAAPVRSEGPFSPFTYEALGATPSVRLPKWLGASAERKAAADAKAQAALKSPAAVGTEDAAQAAAARAGSPSSPSVTPTWARQN